MKDDDIRIPPFETHDLRTNLKKFLDSDFVGQKVGNYTYGVYAFFDYDGEPIYQFRRKTATIAEGLVADG
jgi:hypothetical protein